MGPDGVVHLHSLLDLAAAGDSFPLQLEPAMHWIAESRGAGLAAAVALLAHADLPAAFFCSAGKDRTGMLAAVVLSALGVDRAAIVADYALSGPRLPQSYLERTRPDVAPVRNFCGVSGPSRVPEEPNRPQGTRVGAR